MLSEKVKELEEEAERWHQEYIKEIVKRQKAEELLKQYRNLSKSMIPNQVFTHKERKNTTVKFLDGSQQTVKRRAGEKDCIETAIAYCVLKQLLPAADLKKLIENREEH